MNVAFTRAAEGFPRRAFTVEDIRRMIDAGVIREEEKFELIEGEIVMAAAKGIAHERIKTALVRAIARALSDDLDLGVETTLRLTPDVMLEPDLAVFPRAVLSRAVSGFAQLDPGEALLVIEVAPRAWPTTPLSKHGFTPARACASSGWSTPIAA